MAGKLSEALAVVSCIDPDANTASTILGDAVCMGSFHKVMYILMAGDLGSSATLDYEIYGCATVDGSYTAFTTRKNATQLTQAGSDSNKQVIIEIDAQECRADGYKYVKDRMVVATATSDAGAVGIGAFHRYAPASDYDLDSVDEIKAAP